MNVERETALNCLMAISPDCSYPDWVKVGMALKSAGCPVEDWDAWSQRSEKYKPGDCAMRWSGFNDKISLGSLLHLAKQGGYMPPKKEIDSSAARTRQELEKIYAYKDEHGKAVALNLRYRPKAFSQRFALVDNADPASPGNNTQWCNLSLKMKESPLFNSELVEPALPFESVDRRWIVRNIC